MFRIRFETLTQWRPNVQRLRPVLVQVAIGVIPAVALVGVAIGNTTIAVVGVVACSLLYQAGYQACEWTYGQRMADKVAAARRDPLTGLPGRQVANDLLHDATRTGADVTVALADVDQLRVVNNTFGHAAGDQYLIAVAARLAQAMPKQGCLVRQGGDEFVLVAPGTDPHTLAAAIEQALAAPVVIAGERLRLRVSVGVAESRGGNATYTRGCADAALATARADGGGRAVVYQPDRDGRPNPDGTRPLVRRDNGPL